MSDIQNLVILTREDLTKQGYVEVTKGNFKVCLLYTSDAADDAPRV